MGCLHLSGGPNGLLQCVAWAGMLVRYSSQDGVVEGVKKTFDGQHLCPLCQALQTERQKPKDPGTGDPASPTNGFQLAKDWTPLDWVELPPLVVLAEVKVRFFYPIGKGGIGAHAPPTPPPRRTLV